MNSVLFEAKARKGTYNYLESSDQVFIIPASVGLTFDQIAKDIGRNEVWLAAAFYGQVCSFHFGKNLPRYIMSYCAGQIYRRGTR